MVILYVALGLACVAALVFAAKVVRSILTRRYYEKQGVAFVTTYPFIGSEVDVSDLIGKNKTRDYLYTKNKRADFVGSIRGFDVQLYSVNKETTEKLINPANIGVYIDRDTPALYSFGQLSPQALTFTPIRTEFFHERKANILKGFDLERMDRVSRRLAGEYCRKIAGTDRVSAHGHGIAIDINTKHTDYWRWSKPGPDGSYAYKNKIPSEIVEIFERHGFIWGGKWHHYDTMHFEYRPELVGAGR